MKLVVLPSTSSATGSTWRERLAALGVRTFDSLVRRTNPFAFFARVLRLTSTDMAEQLGVDVVVVELLLAGEADEVIEPVRDGLRRQGLDPEVIAAWYESWLRQERARWAA